MLCTGLGVLSSNVRRLWKGCRVSSFVLFLKTNLPFVQCRRSKGVMDAGAALLRAGFGFLRCRWLQMAAGFSPPFYVH